ncbi:MAG: HemK/PrmC family methyltransferase [Candidatus Shapirobacteria bacterium]
MTIKQALTGIIQLKNKPKIKFPHFEAEILLSHIIKKPREYLFAHPEAELTASQITNYKLQITRRSKGMPIAYLTGEKEFYGLKFLVNKNVLVPRPETELMAEEAVKLAKTIQAPITFIDVGTGSGCIVITLAKLLANFGFSIFDFRFYGLDISSIALKTAQKNAKLHSVSKQIHFLKSNLLDSLPKSKIQNPQSKIFLANLPYLTPAQIKNSPTIKYEPKIALSAGSDGLKYYRKLFFQIHPLRLRSEAGKLPACPPMRRVANFIILCEIDPSQKTSIKRLARRLLPPHEFTLKRDLRGHNRLAIITNKQ